MLRRPTKGVSARARLMDRAGRYLISIGGIGIIAAVLGIFIFILKETYPLFQSPEVGEEGSLQLEDGESILKVGTDPYREIAYVVRAEGVDFLRLDSGAVLRRERPAELEGRRVVSACVDPRNGYLGLGLDNGQVLVARVDFELDYAEGKRQVRPVFSTEEFFVLDPEGEGIAQVVLRHDGEGRSAALGITVSGRLLALLRKQQQGLLDPGKIEGAAYELSAELSGNPTALLVDGLVRQGLVGTDRGEVYEWLIGDVEEKPSLVGSFAAADPGVGITALEFILGDVSVAVGDATGQVSTWFKVTALEGQDKFHRVHVLQAHEGAVKGLATSQRDKQFLSIDEQGVLALHHATSEQTFFQIETRGMGIKTLSFAPKADGFLLLDAKGHLLHYELHNPHPEITLGVLFDEVWYEGYGKPGHTWQSTGGTDEFEPKISLVPLIFGTAKGTLYAMLFALPLAILAALYTAEFASPRIRNVVKPVLEIMASLPSVILGFLAALWLAPLLEAHLAGTLMLFPVVPLMVVLAAWAWQWFPGGFRILVSAQAEIHLLILVTLLASGVAFYLGPLFESRIFEGGIQQWLAQDSGTHYDQRNALIVGFAMGFAVIPLIFTICEDALSTVSSGLRAGSLALGATRWQTAVRVVLPMAVPGMFSAAMIGFGRAVGETMIVLMATGNTPIMDWSVFNGMRAISANIAVELPEAPQHGSLYRVLFLSGLLLFVVTFVINTVAEMVRQHLRERYNRL